MQNKKIFTAASFIIPVLLGTVAFAATTIYRTGNNDTLSSVAKKHNMTVEQVATANPNAKLVSRQNLTVTVPDPTPTPNPEGERKFNVYVTGYTWHDNTPPGSADIALPVIHQKAGGTGTFTDPITVAVGHSIINGKSIPDYAAGTKFYIPNVRRYFIVEDVCGDGSRPQNGPCHTGYPSGAEAWLDIWIDGQTGTKSQTNACAEAITGVFAVIKNPAAIYAVDAGSVFSAGKCATQYGNSVVTI